MSWQDAVFLSALNAVGSMLAWMIMDISVVQIDKEIFFLFAQRKEMVWKIPMIAALLSAGEISAICIFQKYKELQGERERHFAEEQQMKAMKRRLEEAGNFYGSIRKVRHEMKGYMTNVKGLVAGEKYGEVERYIEKLNETRQQQELLDEKIVKEEQERSRLAKAWNSKQQMAVRIINRWQVTSIYDGGHEKCVLEEYRHCLLRQWWFPQSADAPHREAPPRMSCIRLRVTARQSMMMTR